MKTKTYKTWKFKELSNAMKEKVVEKYADINIDHNWWRYVDEDAKNVGIGITEFDIDHNTITGKWIENPYHTANKILTDYDTGNLVTTAKTFLDDRDSIVDKAKRDENKDFANEPEVVRQVDKLEVEFLHNILKDYLILFRKEHEYLTSREVIIETIEANDYDFTEDGKID